MAGFYLLMLIFVALVAFAGYNETMKIIQYADLQIRYFLILLRMKWLGWKLKRQLVKDTTEFKKFLKGYKNGQ